MSTPPAPPSAAPLPVPAVDPPVWEAAGRGAVVVRDTGLGLVAFAGADAAGFLHGQLSSDVKALGPGEGQRSTYNSPKGRMLATLFLWRSPGPADADAYEALVADDLAEPVRKRLAMFVLRSKVTVADRSGATVRIGVGGPGAGAAVEAALGAVPPRPGAADAGEARVVRLPEGRFVVVASPQAADAIHARLAAHAAPAPREVWEWLGVQAAVPVVTAATQDLFVAQTANQDALGGLDFRKGCYPGQEIVARTQYLGRLKERLYVLAGDAPPPAPGTRIYAGAFEDQACGTIVNSAPRPDGGSAMLAVMRSEAAEGTVALGARDGPAARVQPLPYALPEPAAPRGRVRL